MATKIEQHILRWHQTRSFLATVHWDHPEWAVTAAFYAALHGVQALLLQRGENPGCHTERNRGLKDLARRDPKDDTLKELSTKYKALREASNHARYEPTVTRYVEMSAVQIEIVDGILREIEALLAKALGRSAVGALQPVVLMKPPALA